MPALNCADREFFDNVVESLDDLVMKDRLHEQTLAPVFGAAARQQSSASAHPAAAAGEMRCLVVTSCFVKKDVPHVRRVGEHVGMLARTDSHQIVVISQIFACLTGPEEHRLDIIGREGVIAIDLNRSDRAELSGPALDQARWRRLHDAGRAFLNPAHWRTKFTRGTSERSFSRSLTVFAQAALEGWRARPDINDGYRSLMIVEAAEEAARRCATVETSWTTDEDPAGE